MTWPRYLEVCEYWHRVPPIAEVLAGFTGASSPSNSSVARADDNTDLITDLQAAGFSLPADFSTA